MNAKARTQGKRLMIHGQPSWRLVSSGVEAFVTEMGGQLGPVTFDRKGRELRPYSVAPWAEERLDPSQPPIIKALRGDLDRKSTRLNSSHLGISYAVFCLKKK